MKVLRVKNKEGVWRCWVAGSNFQWVVVMDTKKPLVCTSLPTVIQQPSPFMKSFKSRSISMNFWPPIWLWILAEINRSRSWVGNAKQYSVVRWRDMISRLACPWFHSLDWQKTFLGTSNIMLWCKDCGLKESPSIPPYWTTSSGYSYHDSNELSHPRSRQKRSSTSITNKSIHISGLTRQNGRDRSIPTLYPTTPLDSDDTYNNKKRKGRKKQAGWLCRSCARRCEANGIY